MQPISENNRNIFKGPSSSAEFNKLRDDIHYDISNLFIASNKNEKDILRNMEILIRENYFLQNKIGELENKLRDILSRIDHQLGIDQFDTMHKTFTNMDGITQSSQAMIDTVYKIATIKPAKDAVSKTSILDTKGNVYIPNTLEVSIHESFDPDFTEYVTIEEDFSNIFDRNIGTYWTRNAIGKDTDDALYINLHIKLPLNIMNNAFVNTLRINPYPEYGLSLVDIWYKGFGDTWHRLSTYPLNADNSPREISNISRGKFIFPEVEMTELQIKFKQPYWLLEQGKKIFTYGFQEIGIEYNQFDEASAKFLTKLSIAGTGKRFISVNKPVAIPAIGCPSNIQDLVDFKLYHRNDLNSGDFPFGYEIMEEIDTVYIETTLYQKGGVVPVIEGFEVKYLSH